MSASVIKVGQLWQGTNFSTLDWKEAALLEVVGVDGLYANLKYLSCSKCSPNVGSIRSFSTILTELSNWRQVRACKVCLRAWPKDPTDLHEGLMVCWKCEII